MSSSRTISAKTPRLGTDSPRDPAATVILPSAATRLSLIKVGQLVDLLFDWQERRRQRRHLARLGDYMLRDIGLSAADVEHETHKPFWRP